MKCAVSPKPMKCMSVRGDIYPVSMKLGSGFSEEQTRVKCENAKLCFGFVVRYCKGKIGTYFMKTQSQLVLALIARSVAAFILLIACGASLETSVSAMIYQDRSGQDLDEPRLFPMFGKGEPKTKEDVEEILEAESTDTDGRVKPLKGGFTGILTFLTPEQTDLSIGVGPVIQPDYFGSDDYELQADPQFYIRVRNFVFFDDDGADIALFGFSGFRLGPSIRLAGDRDEDENSALTGLGRIGPTVELGGFVSTTFLNRYSVKFKVRKGVATGHRGVIVDAFGTALLFKYGSFSTSVSAQASWIGNQYADAFFSVTPEQSLNSGLNQFDARSGFRNIGGSLNGYINLGKSWSLNPYISYDYIVGDIHNTPIIDQFGSRNQVRAGFHVIRQFSLF